MSDSTRRSLLSADVSTCMMPRTLSSYGDRTFAATGPRLWNSLPVQLRNPDIIYGLFRRQLRGHLFREAWTRHSVTSDMRCHRKTLTYLPTYLSTTQRNLAMLLLAQQQLLRAWLIAYRAFYNNAGLLAILQFVRYPTRTVYFVRGQLRSCLGFCSSLRRWFMSFLSTESYDDDNGGDDYTCKVLTSITKEIPGRA